MGGGGENYIKKKKKYLYKILQNYSNAIVDK